MRDNTLSSDKSFSGLNFRSNMVTLILKQQQPTLFMSMGIVQQIFFVLTSSYGSWHGWKSIKS